MVTLGELPVNDGDTGHNGGRFESPQDGNAGEGSPRGGQANSVGLAHVEVLVGTT